MHFSSFSISISAMLSCADALGVLFEANSPLPVLRLPYGAWRAATYDNASDVFVFRNIRYAANPTGPLRWAKPAVPEYIDTIQDGAYGPNCVQVIPPPPFDASPIYKRLIANAAEDCLFLDVYVPGKALRDTNLQLPVITWIHGGGFVSGSKDEFPGVFEGTNLVQRAHNKAIVVAVNYRLGGFGFLTGRTVEIEATPNVGLHDQRAALTWIRSYISLLGGDPTDVSVWGESGGASSILYHLVAGGGKLDPLFHKAVVLSPASGQSVDRVGFLERKFESFASFAGCGKSVTMDSITCLRSANITALTEANVQAFPGATPAPDGSFIHRNPILEFEKGNFWKGLKLLIVSHVANEGQLFSPHPPPTNFINDTLARYFPSYAQDQVSLLNRYYIDRYNDNETRRVESFMRDLNVGCNIRAVVEAYAHITRILQYSATPGTHGSDLTALWYDTKSFNVTNPIWASYQRYLLAYGLVGDLRTETHKPSLLTWPKVTGVRAEEFENLMDVSDTGFRLTKDHQILQSTFELWKNALWEATRRGG